MGLCDVCFLWQLKQDKPTGQGDCANENSPHPAITLRDRALDEPRVD